MDKSYIEEAFESGESMRGLAKRDGVAYSTVRYWVKKHGLPIPKRPKPNLSKSEYMSKYIKEKYLRRKLEAIEYKGGACSVCGYNKFYGALEFHHLDPSKKEFSWNKMRKVSEERLKKELDKCELLCSNCHKEAHWIDRCSTN